MTQKNIVDPQTVTKEEAVATKKTDHSAAAEPKLQTAPTNVPSTVATVPEDKPAAQETSRMDKRHEYGYGYGSGYRDGPFRPHAFQSRVQILRAPQASVVITPEAYRKMRLYVEIAGKEVGWLGTASLVDGNVFHIHDTFLLEQEVTAAETELSADGITKLVEDFMLEGDEGFEKSNQLRFWGHSHVRMGTSPSYTDENTMLRFMNEGMEWYIRGIFNKLGRAEFTVYFFEEGYAINDVPWSVVEPVTGQTLLQRSDFSRHGGGQYYDRGNEHIYANDRPLFGVRPTFRYDHPQYTPIADELVPPDELREQIIAEFAAKVTDRVYGFGFLSRWLETDPVTEIKPADPADGTEATGGEATPTAAAALPTDDAKKQSGHAVPDDYKGPYWPHQERKSKGNWFWRFIKGILRR